MSSKNYDKVSLNTRFQHGTKNYGPHTHWRRIANLLGESPELSRLRDISKLQTTTPHDTTIDEDYNEDITDDVPSTPTTLPVTTPPTASTYLLADEHQISSLRISLLNTPHLSSSRPTYITPITRDDSLEVDQFNVVTISTLVGTSSFSVYFDNVI